MADDVATKRRPAGSAPSNGTPPSTPDVEARLLKAALTLFGKKGYAAVSVREVARAAGVTTPNVYYYFGSKRGLYLRLLHELLERRATAVRTALTYEGDPVARLRKVLEAYVWFDADEPVDRDAQMFLLRELNGLGTDLFTDLVTEADASSRRALRQVLEEGIRQGVFRPVRVEHTSIAMLGVLLTFIRRAALGVKVRPADGIAQVMDTMLEGLRERGSSGEESAVTPVGATNGRVRGTKKSGG